MNTVRFSKLLMLHVLAGVLTWAIGVHAAQEKSSNTNAPSAQLPIPRSEFDDALPNGRDPFFPRFRIGPASVSTTLVRPAPSLLRVKGVSGRGEKRLVVIGSVSEPAKSWSFEAGDERDVVLGGARVKVRCEEIRDDVVVLSIGTPPQRVELPMPRAF